MASTLAIFAVLVLLGHQIKAQSDIFEHANELLGELRIVINGSVHDSLIEFNNLSGQMSSTKESAQQIAQQAIQTIIRKLEVELSNIRSISNDSTLVEQCIYSYADEIGRLPSYVEDLMDVCIGNIADRVNAEIDSGTTYVTSYNDRVYQIRLNLDDCQFASDSEECAAYIVIEILIQKLEIPTNIREATRRSSNIIRVYLGEVGYCITHRLEGADVIADTIVRHIKTCASIS